MSESLLDRLIRHEGFKSMPYQDTLGNWTVGIGHCISKEQCADYPNGISYADALKLLEADILAATKALTTQMPWVAALDAVRVGVLIEMVFQMGIHGVMGFHNMITAMQIQDWPTAAEEMLKSKWHAETPARAEELAELMLNGQS